MALVQIADVIVPEVYGSYMAVNSPELSAFYQSGIITQNALLDGYAVDGGNTVNLPFWNDLDSDDEPNLSDDSENSATPNKIVAGKQVARSAYLNQWYKASDLAGELAGSDPMKQVASRFSTYWLRQWQRRLIASSDGILADNVANDSSDMVVDVASESIAGQGAGTLFNLNSFVDAIGTAGDADSMFTTMCVHSAVMAQMRKNNDIDFIPDSEGKLTIPTYQGLRLIQDDGMTVTAGGTDGFKYTSVIYGGGAFGYGNGSPKVPMELHREPLQGEGGGTESIGERKTWLLHPGGFADTGTPSGESYTLAELRLAATWNRVVVRKNVNMAFLITN